MKISTKRITPILFTRRPATEPEPPKPQSKFMPFRTADGKAFRTADGKTFNVKG